MLEDFKFDWKSHKWAILYCSISAIGALCYGYDNTYYNGVLAMQEFKDNYGNHYEDGKKALSTSFQSVTASSIYIGDLLGAMIASPVNERWGRKAVFWLASVCILVGGIAQVSDNHHEAVITVGRIMMGLGVGQFTVTSLLYMGEVAPTAIRGPVLMMFQFLQSWSQLIAAGITQGTEGIKSSLSYKIPMGGLIILPLMMFAGLPFIPESPVWHILKGNRESAETALKKINRGQSTYDPAEDMRVLDETRAMAEQNSEESSWRSLLVDPVERRKVIFSSGALFSQQVCGILFFYVYGVVFAQSIGIAEPFMIQLITNILQIFAVGASVVTGNKVSRRANLLVTNSIMVVAFIVIGSIGTQGTPTKASQYVIVVFSFVVIVAFNYGLGPLAYTIAREMAVGVNQNKIMSTSIVIFYFTTWVVSFTAPYLYYDAGLGPMLAFIYAGTTGLALVYTWVCVGETSGKSTVEISMFFSENIPVRKWKTYEFQSDMEVALKHGSDNKPQSGEESEAAVEHREAKN